MAEPLRIVLCISNEHLIGPPARAAMRHALSVFERRLGASFVFGCDDPRAVKVSFGEIKGQSDALATVRVTERRILPEIIIFYKNFRELYFRVTHLEEGCAYATVLSHELEHLLRQTQSHDPNGLRAPALAREDLLCNAW